MEEFNNNNDDLLIGVKFSKFNFELSKAEALCCSKIYFETEVISCFDDVCIFLIKRKDLDFVLPWLNRLAFAKEAYLISLKDSWIDVFLDVAPHFNLVVGLESSFKIFLKSGSDKSLIERIANYVIEEGLSSRVCVKSPDLSIFLFDNYYGLKIWQNVDDFESRRAHLKKSPHPTSINPRLARAMINLASAKVEVLDPFCGAGGILEEARLVNLNYFGVDISNVMIRRAKDNLGSSDNLFCTSALLWDKVVECVISDLPYGKSSFLDGSLSDLVFDFFVRFNDLTKKIVLCLPMNIVLTDILKKNGWNMLFSFDIFVHKSLTRRIYVLEKD